MLETPGAPPLVTFVVRVVRKPATYMVDPDLNAAMHKYAQENGYTVARVVDTAMREFLDARC